MKKNRSLLLLLLAFALLLGGAYALYGRLSRTAEPEQLSTQGKPGLQAAQETPPAETATPPATPQVAEEPVASAPTADEPVEKAPIAQGPTVDVPAAEEPVAETPTASAPTAEEPTADGPAPGEGEEESEPDKIAAPDFTVYDIDGNEAHLSDYLGKPVVLNFWASWCGPCQREMPDFNDAWAELGDDVQFLMVNATSGRETVDTASAFVTEQGFSFPVLYDTDSAAGMVYGVSSLPTTFFIDAEGYAIAWAAGSISRDTLQKGIDMIYPGGGE